MNKREKALFSMLTLSLMVASSSIGYAVNAQSIEIEKMKGTELDIISLGPSIIIPDDFPTIQEGINHASPGNIIFIRTGIYKEHLIINKTGIILQGEDKYNTILDGGKTKGEGIVIQAENVTIKKLTIKNFKNHQKDDICSWNQAGIEIHLPNATITDNRFIENGVGIELYYKAFNTTITNNEMINDGILLGNYFYSFEFPHLTLSSFLHNIYNNTVNGKPLYYFKNKKDFTVPTDAGQITMVNCSNFIIKNIHMSNNDFSILLAFCYNSLIENNTIADTNGEILLFACENNTIQHNTITNTFKAICLEYKSKNNIIKYNDLSKNYVGISLFNNASNNTIYQNKVYNNYGQMSSGIEIVSYHGGTQQDNNITENQIYNNPIGIRLRQNSIKNSIYHNDIIKNGIGIYLEKSSNGNIIEYNNFKINAIPAMFIVCNKNEWFGNYWNRPRILPKPILGLNKIGGLPPIPWLNFDLHPAKQPISVE